jgi:hypothetical protein
LAECRTECFGSKRPAVLPGDIIKDDGYHCVNCEAENACMSEGGAPP